MTKPIQLDSFGGRLCYWRTSKLGLTQQGLADRTNIKLVMLKKYEADKAQPGSPALAALAETGVNLNWLLTGLGEVAAHSFSALEYEAGEIKRTPEDFTRMLVEEMTSFSLRRGAEASATMVKVFTRLGALVLAPQLVPWMPEDVSFGQVRATALHATWLLEKISLGSEERFNALVDDQPTLLAALQLGWKIHESIHPGGKFPVGDFVKR